MNSISKMAFLAAALAIAGQAAAQVTLYERDDFRGRSFSTSESVQNLKRKGFNDRSSSVSVQGNKSERWEVCEDRRFRGHCVILRRGDYPSLAAMGLNDQISSVRAVGKNERFDNDRYAPLPQRAEESRVVFYEREGFKGRSFAVNESLGDLRRNGFNDRISSVVVSAERWEVCQNTQFTGRCVVLRPGRYASLEPIGLDDRISSVRSIRNSARVAEDRYAPMRNEASVSQVVLYEHEGFQGRSFTAEEPVDDFRRSGLNNRASSAVVRGERWEVCDEAGYYGRCAVLRPGQYASLAAMGMNDRVSSVRAVNHSTRIDDNRYSPPPVAVYDYGRRPNERVYEASITSVRAVMEDNGHRCWVEREQAVQERSAANVPGALIGALIGGVLGHQVGGGSGKDVATGVGAVTGALIGARTGGSDQQTSPQNVQRCASSPGQAHPAYWDVTYVFRGVEHRVQMTTPPGAFVSVNEDGEPRV